MRPAQRLDGRVVAATAVVLFFVVMLSFRAVTGSMPWAHVGVLPASLSFADLRSVTSAWDCERRGIQAFPYNPCDPFLHDSAFRRTANYPRMWLALWHLGLGEGDTVPLGIAIAVLFYVAALAVAGPLTSGGGLVYTAALLSPATLLGVERGNVDLLMFVLVVIGVLLLRRSPCLAAIPITAAGALKLFPATAVVVFARERRRWLAGAVSVLVLLGYVLATLNDIRTLRSVIPRLVANSYGAGVIPVALHMANVSWAQSAASVRYLRLALIAAGLLFALALYLSRRDHTDAPDRKLDAFWAGAAVYAGSWVFGNNFDYRLAFLILCIPQLWAWSTRERGPVPGAPLALAALLTTLWLSSLLPPLPFGLQTWYEHIEVPPEEVLNLLLFGWLVAAVAATAPVPALRRRLAWRHA
jgi:hypothetical protein